MNQSVSDREERKILEGILYFASKATADTFYYILKHFYIADKEHMERYGRFIFKDRYVAMRAGPCPSSAYSIIKTVRTFGDPATRAFSVSEDHVVTPSREPDLGMFSDSDIECMDAAIDIGNRQSIANLSHDKAWRSTNLNDCIQPEQIISTLRNSEMLLDLHLNRHV